MGLEKARESFGPKVHEEEGEARGWLYHGVGVGHTIWGWTAHMS